MASKMVQQVSGNRYFWRQFSKVDFFDTFWSSFVSFWLPLGSPLVPFWLPLAAFWFPLASFWLTFRALWLTFGALGITFAHPCARSSHFRGLLASFLIFLEISMGILCKFVFVWKILIEMQLICYVFFSAAKHPKTIPGTRTPPSFGHGAETCRRQPLFLGSSFQSWGRRNRVA